MSEPTLKELAKDVVRYVSYLKYKKQRKEADVEKFDYAVIELLRIDLPGLKQKIGVML